MAFHDSDPLSLPDAPAPVPKAIVATAGMSKTVEARRRNRLGRDVMAPTEGVGRVADAH